MAQISLRLSDEQEQRLRQTAEVHNIRFTVYLRQLLELGEQVQETSSAQQTQTIDNQLICSESTDTSRVFAVVSENLYLMRYLIGKLFKEEGKTVKNIAYDHEKQVIFNEDNK